MYTAGARGGAGKDPRRKTGALNNKKITKIGKKKEEKGMDERRRQRYDGEEGKGTVWSPEEGGPRRGGAPRPESAPPRAETRLGAAAGPGPVPLRPPRRCDGPPGSGRRASPGLSPGQAGLRRGRRSGAAASFINGEFGRRGDEGQYL